MSMAFTNGIPARGDYNYMRKLAATGEEACQPSQFAGFSGCMRLI